MTLEHQWTVLRGCYRRWVRLTSVTLLLTASRREWMWGAACWNEESSSQDDSWCCAALRTSNTGDGMPTWQQQMRNTMKRHDAKHTTALQGVPCSSLMRLMPIIQLKPVHFDYGVKFFFSETNSTEQKAAQTKKVVWIFSSGHFNVNSMHFWFCQIR